MIFFIAKVLTKIFGLDIQKAQKYASFGLIAALALILLVAGLFLRGCWTAHKLKLTQKQIETINNANEEKRKEELKQIIIENSDTIKTVDNRTNQVIANVDNRDKEVDKLVIEADKKIAIAQQREHDVTSEELECILIPEHCQ